MKGTCKLCAVEPQVIARVGQPLHHSVALWRGELRKRTVPVRGFWGFARHSPHFQSLHHSLYATDALPSVALVLNPRVCGFAYVWRPVRAL